MTQTRCGPESLPAKKNSTLSPPLLYWQWRCFFESQLISMFLLWSAALRAQSGAQLMPAVPLVRKTATEVSSKLRIQLRLHNHCSQCIQRTNR
jgi:hypothetical protein